MTEVTDGSVGEFSGSSGNFRTFAEAFASYFSGGMRDGKLTRRSWTRTEFAERIAKLVPNRVVNEEDGYRNTVRGWEEGARPREWAIGPIVQLFCGDATNNADAIGLCNLWAAAKAGKNAAGEPSSDPGSEWVRTAHFELKREVPKENEELFDIAVHRPSDNARGPNSFGLFVTLNPGLRPDKDGRLRWKIGVKRFNLLGRAEGCQLVSRPEKTFAGVKPVAGGWIVGSDQPDARAVTGDQLSGEPLAEVEHDGMSETMMVALHAKCDDETDIVVEWDKVPRSIAAKRRQIIKRFLQKCARTEQRWVFLGEARLIAKRKS